VAVKSSGNTRTLILVSAALTLAGIAFSVSEDTSVGSWFTLIGLVLSILALHRFGRLGPDSGRVAPSGD
jgi:hypothetical protein